VAAAVAAGVVEPLRLAAALLALDPQGLGGVRLVAQAGPVREAWLGWLQAWRNAGHDGGCAWRRLPPQAGEDRLLGGLDLAATLAAGRSVLQPGLLAESDGGFVLVPMAERLPAGTAALLAAARDSGQVRVERDGITALLPSRVSVVALDEALPDDTPLAAALAARLGLWIDLTAVAPHRVDGAAAAADAASSGTNWPEAIAAARVLLPRVRAADGLIEALCATALALGVDDSRAVWFALRAALASAALFGRTRTDADDAALAARLVLAPRATRLPTAADAPAPQSPEPPPEPPHEPDGEAQAPAPAADEVRTLEDQVQAAAMAAIPAGLLARLVAGDAVPARGSAAAGHAGALAMSRLRGRPLGARPGVPHAGQRLHLIATLRAAAPWQRLRRAAAAGTPAAEAAPIQVRKADFHVRRHAQRRGTATLFAVDASGSQALHRLAEAKGAVELMLAECYVRRDEVALIAFRGAGAELLLPPTRSLVRAKRALAGLPGGGGTPLAAGIEAAARLARQVQRSGATPVVVLLTDGRANVARYGEGGRAQAQADALAAARWLRAAGVNTLLVDTSPRPEPAAAALALAMGARYLALPLADARGLARVVGAAAAAA
jgi:magnesium chelatase subunit D